MAQFTKEVLQFVLSKLWPWFKAYVWPLLREHVLEIAQWAITQLKESIKKSAEGRAKAREQEAAEKANEAEEAARKASTDEERRTQEAVAQVWREVAEQFRVENELLRSKIEELSSAAAAEIAQRTRDIDPKLDSKASTPMLVLGDTRTSLPILPPNS